MPYRNRQVQCLNLLSAQERYRQLGLVAQNVERLPDEAVFLDVSKAELSAISDRQLAAMQLGDEAYAGSRSFRELSQTIIKLFGKPFVVPAHHVRGAVNLLVHHLLGPEVRVLAQPLPASLQDLLTSRGAHFSELALEESPAEPFGGNVDLQGLERALKDGVGPAVLWLASTVERHGEAPISLHNFKLAAGLARAHGVPVVWHLTWMAPHAWTIQTHEGLETARLLEIIRLLAEQADYVCADGVKAGAAPKGAFLATAMQTALEHLRSSCIVFEGMPFYGGLAGRDMACLSIGLEEALDEPAIEARAVLLAATARRLQMAGLPAVAGAAGLDVDMSKLGARQPAAKHLAALLYLLSGVRLGVVEGDERLRVYWPLRGGDPEHLLWVSEALLKLWEMRDQGSRFEPSASLARMALAEPLAPPYPAPYQAKVLERLPGLEASERASALREAGYNMAFLEADAVTIDCFTDSGTNAQSDSQEASMLCARFSEALAGFQAAVSEVHGFPYVTPAHQGRGAEAILSEVLISSERPLVVGNQPFVTTLGHIQRCGGRFMDVSVPAAFTTDGMDWFKGDVDLDRLEEIIQSHGPAISYLNLGVTVNSSGGHPVRLQNLRSVRRLADDHGLRIVLDATRAVENAWFIQTHESGYASLPIQTILREMMSLADGVTISAKKDLLVHIGGFIATRHEAWHTQFQQLSERYEARNGGLAARDLAAMTQGLYEMVDDAYITHRILQVASLGERLRAMGVPTIRPVGGHAVFVDAEAFLPHLQESDHPGHALAAALYLEAGIRGMRVRSAFDVGEKRRGKDLLRLAIPRRVYHNGHLETIAQAVGQLYTRRETISGLELAYEPSSLRSTLSRFRPKGEG